MFRYGESLCGPPTLGTRLYSFWSDSPNRLLKAAIAFSGPISGPLLVITGISLTAVSVIALVGGCICCFSASTGG